MAKFFDVSQAELIEKAAEELKKSNRVRPPEWAIFVKTGAHKERPPARSDWWYVRAAAVLRKVAVLGPIGVSKLRVKYGGKKNRGHKPEKFVKAGGCIIRKVLQQLEATGYLKTVDIKGHKGRKITGQGVKFLDAVALQIKKSKPVEKKEIVAEQPKEIAEKKEIPPANIEQKAPAAEKKPKKLAEKKPEQV